MGIIIIGDSMKILSKEEFCNKYSISLSTYNKWLKEDHIHQHMIYIQFLKNQFMDIDRVVEHYFSQKNKKG